MKITVFPDREIGPVKPVNGVGQPPMVDPTAAIRTMRNCRNPGSGLPHQNFCDRMGCVKAKIRNA